MIENIKKDILNAYKNLDHPTFEFVLKNAEKNWYKELIEMLESNLNIQDISDFNYEFCYSIVINNKKLLLLSLVGPYALLLNILPDALPKLIDNTSNDVEDQFIFRTLKDFKLEIPEKIILETKIPLNGLENISQDQVRIFNALFIDNDKLPWEE